MSAFFTSDQHYFHSNILSFRDTQDRPQRPFKTLAEMHDCMISRHNSIVTAKDITYHLGDFFFGRSWKDAQNILKRLKGKHVLVLGNHDHLPAFDYVEAGFESVHTSLTYQGLRMVHDPAPAGVFKAETFIHGHTHGLGKRLAPNTLCVCVELWEYYPVSLEQVTDEIRWKYV